MSYWVRRQNGSKVTWQRVWLHYAASHRSMHCEVIHPLTLNFSMQLHASARYIDTRGGVYNLTTSCLPSSLYHKFLSPSFSFRINLYSISYVFRSTPASPDMSATTISILIGYKQLGKTPGKRARS